MGNTAAWIGVLGTGITAAFGLLFWVLKKSDRALERSDRAITLSNESVRVTGETMALIEALRHAIWMQGDSLDAWEDYGVDVKRIWRKIQHELIERGMITEVGDLPTPPVHLDLSAVFRHLPQHGPRSASGGDAV